MIGKGGSIAHGGAAIAYALGKEDAQLIDSKYIASDNAEGISAEFKVFQDLNANTTNNTLAFVLSPSIPDGHSLDNDGYRSIAEDFLKEMGLEDHQSVTIKHTDAQHHHLHLLVNRIGMDGKAYKDSFVSKKAQSMADKIAREKGLVRAKEVQQGKAMATKHQRAEIYAIHQLAIGQRPQDFKAYSAAMQGHGVKVLPTVNNSGKLQGFRVEFKGLNLKASAVHSQMTLSKMGAKALGIGTNPVLTAVASVARKASRGISR